MAWKTPCSPGRSVRSETDTNRITIGLTLRRTARKIRRLKGVVGGMCPGYSDPADPRFPDALLKQRLEQEERERQQREIEAARKLAEEQKQRAEKGAVYPPTIVQ